MWRLRGKVQENFFRNDVQKKRVRLLCRTPGRKISRSGKQLQICLRFLKRVCGENEISVGVKNLNVIAYILNAVFHYQTLFS